MIGKFYIYSPLTLTSTIIEVGKNADCPLCGENPQITGLPADGGIETASGQGCGT